ncbi:MAG: hypothetical protein ACLGIA_04235 [Actinomycetes bacterium]
MKLAHVPLRLATGAFILNSGLSKRGLEGEDAAGLQGMAAQAVPSLGEMDPAKFAKLLSTGEIALGAALLAPFVPSFLAGAGLAAFAGGLLRLYWKVPGLRQPGDIRPTQDGIGIAKDVWLVGAGLTLALDDLIGRRPSKD